MVTTVDGTTEYFKNCKKIDGDFYRMNDQCFLIGDKWYPTTSTAIVYDHEKKEYVLRKGQHLLHGVVDFVDNNFVFGDFSPNIYFNCRIGIISDRGRDEHYCMSYKIPRDLGYVEHISEALWASREYLVNPISKKDLGYLPSRASKYVDLAFNCGQDFTNAKQYSFDKNSYNAEESNEFEKRIEEYNAFDTPLTKDVRRAGRFLGDITFGVEAEAKRGMLPDYLMAQLGVIICKDGSIQYSPEFVSVPYSGAKGLQSLKNLFIELNKRCTTDSTCSLHYHIGTIRKDREFLVAIFKLYSDIQNELHAMLPYYKTNPEGIKKKNYCQFLNKEIVTKELSKKTNDYKTKINNSYNNIFTWLMEGRYPDGDFNRTTMRHPNGTQKWGFNNRYFSLNVLNMFLSKRQTLEFRASHGLLHPTKAINWFFICVAIVKYAEQHSSHIIADNKTITLTQVLNYYKDTFKTDYAGRVSDYLIAYHKNRKEFFLKKFQEGDRVVDEDYLETQFEFEAAGLKEIY